MFGIRPRGKKWLVLAFLSVALMVYGIFCGPTPGQEKFSAALPSDRFDPLPNVAPGAIGMPAIALTPRNFPNHRNEDFSDMFKVGSRLAQGAVFLLQWSDPNLPKAFPLLNSMARAEGLTPILGLSPTTLDKGRKELDVPKSLRGKRSFADANLKAAFIKTAEDLARLKPVYLCLASEINFLALQRIDEYVRFATLYKEAYRAVKKISPDTKVFVSFQYDFVRILDNKKPGNISEHAKLIDIFRPELDMVAITTYPAEYYASPTDMPSNYYAHLRNYLKAGDEVMVMEIGWPRAGKGGSEAKQEQFIQRLPGMFADLAPKVTAWSLLHDVKHGIFSADLTSTGLYARDGSPKAAVEAWRQIAKPAPR